MSAKRRHGPYHHIVPTSRGGPKEADWNKFSWKAREHQAWHTLFVNALPSEAIEIIRSWMDEDGGFDENKIAGKGRKKKLKAWQEVFYNWSPERAINFVEENFLPAEIRFKESKAKKAPATMYFHLGALLFPQKTDL